MPTDTKVRSSVVRPIWVVALVVSILAGTAALAAPAWGQASPCPPGQPTGRPPGTPPNQPGQPQGRPPAYPPGECNLALSRSAAERGQVVHATGTGYAPGETVTVTVAGRSAGSAVADSVGTFSLDFTVPADAPVGTTRVLASAASRELSASFEVLAAAESSRASTAAERGGVLSATGSEAGRMALAGVVLVLIGTVLVIVVRRRRMLSAT